MERLESRWLYASDVMALDAVDNPVPPPGLTKSVPQSPSALTKKTPTSTTAAFSYYVGDEKIGLAVASNRLALNPIDAVAKNPGLMTEWGLKVGRPIGGAYYVYESTQPIDDAFRARLIASGLVENAVSVFQDVKSGTEAVLLNEAIVALKPDVAPEKALAGRSEFVGYRPLDGTPDQFVVTLAAGYGETALQAINTLSKDPNLQWSSPNFYQAWQKFFIPNDPRFGNLWNMHNTGQGGGTVDADSDLPEAWEVYQGGSPNLTIGIVDDGVPNNNAVARTNHPDLTAWTNVGEIAGNGVDDDGNGWVDDVNGWNFVGNNNFSIPTSFTDNHGTAVAGVAAARGNNGIGVAGASYGSKVLSARIFEGEEVASDSGIAQALYYASGRTRNGRGTWRASDITNNSWGAGIASNAINEALTWATSSGRQGRGAMQVFASGNDGAKVAYPATQASVNSGIVVIGASNNFGNVSRYSNFGPTLDVVASSDDLIARALAIDTTDRRDFDGYSINDYTGTGATGFGGTSAAAPLATGIMGLAIARSEQIGLSLTTEQMRALMRVNTDMLKNETYDMRTGKSSKSGYGRVNAGSLLRGIGMQEISIQSVKGEVFLGLTVYDMGTVLVGDNAEATFRIRNQGTKPLELSEIKLEPSEFKVVEFPANMTLGLGESTQFTIRFTPTSAASFTKRIEVISNDDDESNFIFEVRGIGKIPNVLGRVFEDWNGDGVYSKDDPPIANQIIYFDENLNGKYDQQNLSFTRTVPLAIKDLSTVTSPLTVSGIEQNVVDLNVNINVQHTFVSDLEIVLIAPDGTRIPLATRVGLFGEDFDNTTFDDQADTDIDSGFAPFTGSFRPASPLSVINGTRPNGVWKLEISDRVELDDGLLQKWRLDFKTSENFTKTDKNGVYFLDGLAPGSYRIGPALPSEYALTTPGFFNFTISTGTEYFPGINFGLYKQGRFYGKVFEDYDGNGIQASNEPGVQGQTLVRPNTLDVLNNFTSTTMFPIIDNGTNSGSLMVDGLPTEILDVNVTLNIEHSFDQDLSVYLVSPGGSVVELFTSVGLNGQNFTETILDDSAPDSIEDGVAPFTGIFRPTGSLAAFNGSNPNGEWQLIVNDNAPRDTGKVLNWSLEITANGNYTTQTDEAGRGFFDLPVGTYTIGLTPDTPWVFTLPSDGKRTVTMPGTMFNQTYGIKRPPKLTVDNGFATGPEGTTITETGTWSTPYTFGSVQLSASLGTVVKNDDGTWSWSIVGVDDTPPTTVTITANDGLGAVTSTSFLYTVTNVAPTLSVAQNRVSGGIFTTLTNTGTWNDVPADTVTLQASLGGVTRKADGTWAWSFVPSQAYNNQKVTITAKDEDGGSSQVDFFIDALPAAVGSKVYYKGSTFAGTSVDAALDPNKVVAKSGATAQQLSFANLINTSRGINGLVIDIAGLATSSLTASDFVLRMSPTGSFNETANPPSSWAAAPSPTLINVTPGTSTTPARVRIEWADNAIANRWLQIKVKANANTGLPTPQTFYVGHLQGETNGAIEAGGFLVRTTDVSTVTAAIGQPAAVGSALDLNKDGLVRTTDVSLASGRIGQRLTRITIPAAGSSGEGEGDGIGPLFAAPGIELPKPSDSGLGTPRTPEIRGRWTDELFDVPLPTSMVAEVARSQEQAANTPSSAPKRLTTSEGPSPTAMASLDAYFETLAPKKGGRRSR